MPEKRLSHGRVGAGHGARRDCRRRRSRRRSGRPLEGAAREEHVPDEGLDRGLADEAHEEQLLYDGRRHRPEGGQSQQQLPEPGRLVGVLTAAVLLECALTLFLKLLDDCCISESRCIYGNNEVLATILSAL